MLICPNEVDEAEDPEYEELDESVMVSDEVPKGMAAPETPSAKEREGQRTDTCTFATVVQCLCPIQRSGYATSPQTCRKTCRGSRSGSFANNSI